MQDKITIIWSYQDIQLQAEGMDIELTDDEAREILGNVKRNHDASIGINWQVIESHIEEFERKR